MTREDGELQAVDRYTDHQPTARSKRHLVAALEQGTSVIVGPQLPEWPSEEQPPAESVITAELLREVLLDRDLATRADPRGLTIRGALIVGELDLNDTRIDYPLRLLCCRFTSHLVFERARLHTLSLSGSHLGGTDSDGHSLVADSLQTDETVALDQGFTAAGAIRLSGARIGGQLSLRGALLNGADGNGYSLVADNLHSDQAVALDQGFTAAGAVRLPGARIGGQLSLREASLNGTDGNRYSLVADRLQAANDVFLDRGFATAGAVRLSGAHIAGPLEMSGAKLSGTDVEGRSLVADNLQAANAVFLDQGFTAAGGVRLLGAHIQSQLSMRGALLKGTTDNGYSLVADNLQAANAVFLDQGFTAAGGVRLLGAHIEGQLIMRGALLNGADGDGDSLVADSLQAANDVFLDRGFATAGAVTLSGGHIAGQLSMRGATLNATNGNGDSLVAENLQTAKDVYLDEGFAAVGSVTLRGADIGNLVVGSDLKALPQLGDVTGWRLRDLQGVIRTDRKAAAEWLDTQQSAQPWQELAAVYERNGQPSDARKIRYLSAVRSTRSSTWPARLSRHAYRCTTGHGYYPLVALAWLGLIFVVALALTYRWADEFTTTTTDGIRDNLTTRTEASATRVKADDPPIPGQAQAAWCSPNWDVPCLNPSVYALTTAFPAAASTQPWSPPDNGWMPIIFYILRLASWVFTALLLAGVTGLLRKQT